MCQPRVAFVLLAAGVSLSALASGVDQESCTLRFQIESKSTAYVDQLVKKRDARRIIQLMRTKGYEVTADQGVATNYALKIRAVMYSWRDLSPSYSPFLESMRVQTAYSVQLLGADGEELVRRGETLERFVFELPSLVTRHALMRELKQLPNCPSGLK